MNRILIVVLIAFVTCTASAQVVVKDRKSYLPYRKHVALKGTVIGILLTDGQPILSTEGRSGPPDQLVFSEGGNSYRWVYITTQQNAQITNLQVPVGAKGETKLYPALNLANPPAVLPFAIKTHFTLVEAEVNDGLGSPAEDSFVATKLKVLDGSKEYPLKVVEVVYALKERYAENVKKLGKKLDQALKDAGDKALKGRPVTGPRETTDLMYVTWLADSSTMRVHFKTTIRDGSYQVIEGGANPEKRPGLPLPPNRKFNEGFAFEPPELVRRPPPKDFKVKVGITFGIEFGQAFVVDKNGNVIATEELPIEAFSQELNAPPGR